MMVRNVAARDQQSIVNQSLNSMRRMARFLQVVEYGAGLPASKFLIATEE